ncbi:hypothetical protein [Streptomyces sp. NWU339]|uniref:hypothetical protein n=1 Tax=Streptomyces sp. NWU339 TaxID=2185284 RepID=UPI0015E8171B|nr:hypothetical protein [Streptomyces sp. NWU339]
MFTQDVLTRIACVTPVPALEVLGPHRPTGWARSGNPRPLGERPVGAGGKKAGFLDPTAEQLLLRGDAQQYLGRSPPVIRKTEE